ncbi:hypothetical protein CTI12_AA484370 [Artemisia annua]|uniref:Uncharacterized protein n=1 Tax=Artemisia annua TaxID=35608 RepID=A0A2U1LIN0_ARTAN|nr:hypothetical protein CTI12_AA484370 [Artemisia annua]
MVLEALLKDKNEKGSLHHKFGRALVFFHKNQERPFTVSVKNVIEGFLQLACWKINEEWHHFVP